MINPKQIIYFLEGKRRRRSGLFVVCLFFCVEFTCSSTFFQSDLIVVVASLSREKGRRPFVVVVGKSSSFATAVLRARRKVRRGARARNQNNTLRVVYCGRKRKRLGVWSSFPEKSSSSSTSSSSSSIVVVVAF